jgi:hypothetical protein
MSRTKAGLRIIVGGLTDDDMSWLQSEADRLGIDPEGVVRATIRQRIVALNVSSSAAADSFARKLPESNSVPPNAALIAGLSDAEYDLAMELSQEELSIAHQTGGGLKQHLTKLQSHAAAVEARLARGGLNGGVPIAPLSQMSASRQAKIADGAV